MTIRVIHVDDDTLAYSFSLWWVKRITVGRRFRSLPKRHQEAVLLHEISHCERQDTLRRLFALMFTPWRLHKVCCETELIADTFAAMCGYAPELIEILKHEFDGGKLQPSHAIRRERLAAYEKIRLDPVKV